MISATFIFDKKQFDARFYQLDEEIAVFARQTPGYLAKKAGRTPAMAVSAMCITGRTCRACKP